MHSNPSPYLTITRDVQGFLIPSGEVITVLKGEQVRITQALGGSYTLFLNGNLVKIDGKDADAIGKEPVVTETDFGNDQEITEDLVWAQLKTCYDPEIPVNIVDLGLVYDLKIIDDRTSGAVVEVKMTLTAPGCGMGNVIANEAERKIESLNGVAECIVELVWEPQWSRDMMSESAQLQLGLL